MRHMTVKYVPPPKEGFIVLDDVQENYPMFEVVKEIFAVEEAEDIPLGPLPKITNIRPFKYGHIHGVDPSSEEESDIDVLNFSK